MVETRRSDATLEATVARLESELRDLRATALARIGEGRGAGEYVAYAGATPPARVLACNGQAVSRQTYARLFSAIGTTYGAGDGSSTFNVPNVPPGTSLVAAGTGFTLGGIGGAATATLAVGNLPAHDHNVSVNSHATHDHNVSTGSAGGHDHSVSTGSGGAHTHVLNMIQSDDEVSGFGLANPNDGFSNRPILDRGGTANTRTAASAGSHSHTVNESLAGPTTHTVNESSVGSGTPVNIRDPWMAANVGITY